MADLRPGDVFAGCRVDAVVGRGGMGVVYRALQLDLQRPVALKVIAAELASDSDFRARFARETRMAAAIEHPNVVPVHAAGEQGGALYLVMRYVSGSDLHAVLRARGGGLPVPRAVAIVEQVAAALDAAHGAGLVHRDVKPANVLLADDGHVYLGDFGLTRPLDPHQPITDSGQWVGTVDFASPEQLRGERTDVASDVYSLGCVLYAALTGGPPFQRGTVPATLLAHLNEAPPRPSAAGAPAPFDGVIARALAKAPEDRFSSAGEVARAAVAAAARGESVAEGAAARGESFAEGAAPTAVTAALAAPARSPTLWASRPAPPAPVASPLPAPARAPAPAQRVRKRSRRGLVAAIAFPLAGIVTVAVLMLGADGGGPAQAEPRALSAQEVRAVAYRFAEAYEQEDGAALRRLVTRDVQRVLPSGVMRGRDAFVAEYERQFRANATQSYEFENLTTRGGAAGRASAGYRVRRRNGASLEGRIVLAVVRDGARARIAFVAVTPRA